MVTATNDIAVAGGLVAGLGILAKIIIAGGPQLIELFAKRKAEDRSRQSEIVGRLEHSMAALTEQMKIVSAVTIDNMKEARELRSDLKDHQATFSDFVNQLNNR